MKKETFNTIKRKSTKKLQHQKKIDLNYYKRIKAKRNQNHPSINI
jgi:hypothetical protein